MSSDPNHDAANAAAETVEALLQRASQDDYIGEDISQLEHALQCAALARRAGAADALVLAALLHDVGHYCPVPNGGEAASMGGFGAVDHEHIGADWLASLGFGAEVTEPIRWHVAAKRYLVATNERYAARLSAASQETLRHQGGPMDDHEVAAFDASPHRDAILALRRWDDSGKVVGLEIPPIEAYGPMLRAHLASAD